MTFLQWSDQLVSRNLVCHPETPDETLSVSYLPPPAHESRRVAVRLKTGAPGSESLRSMQKYPCRSNWKRSSGEALASDGSSRHSFSTSTERGLRQFFQSSPAGLGTLKRRS